MCAFLPPAPLRRARPTRRARHAPLCASQHAPPLPLPPPPPPPPPRRSKLVLTRRVHTLSLPRAPPPRAPRARSAAAAAPALPALPTVALHEPPLPPEQLLAPAPPVLTYVFQRGLITTTRKRRHADPPYRYLRVRYGLITPFSPGYLTASNPRAAGAAALKSWYRNAARWRLLPAPRRTKLTLRTPFAAPRAAAAAAAVAATAATAASPWRGADRALGLSPRLIVVGDVHGCIDELQALLRLADFSPGDQLIFLGDLVAKGPDSAAVVQLAREMGARMVRGNHDYEVIRFCAARRRGVHAVVSPEHARIAATLSSHDFKFLSDAPWFIECARWKHLFVHAGFIPGVKLTQQNPRLMMNMRSVLSDGTVTARGVRGCEWARLWRGPHTVVFGHDACRGLQQHPFAKGIDTGCVYGGRLTALLLPENRFVSVAAKRAYVSPKKLRVMRTAL